MVGTWTASFHKQRREAGFPVSAQQYTHATVNLAGNVGAIYNTWINAITT